MFLKSISATCAEMLIVELAADNFSFATIAFGKPISFSSKITWRCKLLKLDEVSINHHKIAHPGSRQKVCGNAAKCTTSNDDCCRASNRLLAGYANSGESNLLAVPLKRIGDRVGLQVGTLEFGDQDTACKDLSSAASKSARYRPVMESLQPAICSGVPLATTCPPIVDDPGPRSMIQSACFNR